MAEMTLKIGGQAFKNTDELWKKWGVDFYSKSSEDLIRWAEENIG